jgi:hypothetical protein
MTTHVPGPPEPEYLGADAPVAVTGKRSAGGGARRGLVAAAAVAVVAAGGAGAYAVAQLMSGGTSPATAVPATAVGYVSLDLDPSAAQKIEAFKILRKFPAIKKEIGGTDDLRKTIVDQIRKDNDCADLDYAEDIEPWIGNRIAVAAVPDGSKPAVPLLALQVTDQAKAKTGVRALTTCGSDAPSGVAFVGDYLLLADTQKQADAMASDAEQAPLADSQEFTTTMERAGDPGIVSLYVSKDAPQALASAGKKALAGAGDLPGFRPNQLTTGFKDFEGAAGVIRFHDGAVEAEFSAKGLADQLGATSTAHAAAADLPATTAAALSIALPEGWLDEYLEMVKAQLPRGTSLQDMFREGERATGLRLPEDIETLLGTGVSVSVDGNANLRSLADSPDPSTIPAGVRIQGDPDTITRIVTKLKRVAGPDANMVKVRTGDGTVAIGLDREYVETLAQDGGLGAVVAFQDVVPNAERASGVVYVNFDAGKGWADELADLLSDGDPQVKANIAPLDALGVSSWQDDDKVQHGLMRLTTD